MSLDPILYVPSSKHWKDIAREKQDARDALLTAAQTELKGIEPNINYTTATASEIVKKIGEREPGWTAENVLKAFFANAIKAQSKTNCITEVMFTQALVEARELDREFAETGKIRGPLHGVPVSFKDMFEVNGFDASIGFSRWSHKPCKEDAELVKQVRAMGGIPFVKTNVPQTMFAFECANPIWGRSSNPWSSKHTCGGSSGGEAALLTCDGSALGFGSDIGGSLRIPTGYCGIYSLKPGIDRCSTVGTRGCVPGFDGVKTVTGPMARSLVDVELGCRAVFGKSNVMSEGLPPVPYREVQIPPKLKFGYYKSDGWVKSSPACQRAVLETVSALRKEGHECVEFELPDITEVMRLFAALTSADGYKTLTSHHGPDPWDPTLNLVNLGPRLPTPLRNMLAWLVNAVKGDKKFGHVFRNSRLRTVREYWAEVAKRDDYAQLFYREVWERYGFDGIICPVQASPALPHKAGTNLSPLALSTLLYNVVDSPVGVIPVTRVDPAKDATTSEWETDGPVGSRILFEGLFKGKVPFYNPEEMKGLPVGIQVVGKHWEEEKVIEMMKVIDGALGPRDFGPGAWSTDN